MVYACMSTNITFCVSSLELFLPLFLPILVYYAHSQEYSTQKYEDIMADFQFQLKKHMKVEFVRRYKYTCAKYSYLNINK